MYSLRWLAVSSYYVGMGSIASRGVSIVIAQAGDAEGINEVHRKAWLKTYPNPARGISVDDIESRFADNSGERMARRRALLEHPAKGMTTLIARSDSKIVGVCRLIEKDDRNQLQMIYVHPDYQHQGIGQKLWEAGQRYLAKSKDTYVEVVDYNEQAINFYKKLGFIETGVQRQDEHFRLKSGAIFTEIEMKLRHAE